MRYGYACLGRSMQLAPGSWSVNGGDADRPRLLWRLAAGSPGDEWVIVGRNSREDPGWPGNVENPWVGWQSVAAGCKSNKSGDEINRVVQAVADLVWPVFRELDGLVIWAGQHGTTNSSIPTVAAGAGQGPGESVTHPQIWSVNYAGYLVELINRARERDPGFPVVWLVPDVRNYLKARDLAAAPAGALLAQYSYERLQKHFVPGRGDREELHRYAYAGVELTALRGPTHVRMNESPGGVTLGVVCNENRPDGPDRRELFVREYVPVGTELRGVWRAETIKRLGRPEAVTPVGVGEYEEWLRRHRSTVTFPASGSGWVTAKCWEAWALGVACFRAGRYDDQDHAYGRLPAETREFLTVQSGAELGSRVKKLEVQESLWRKVVGDCRRVYEEAWYEGRVVKEVWRGLGSE